MKRIKRGAQHQQATSAPKTAKRQRRTAVEPADVGPATEGGLLAMEEAIGLLKTTRPTFYRWLRSGKLKGMKVGRQWRFYREEIDRFLKGEAPRIELPADIGPLIRTLAEQAGADGVKIRDDEQKSPLQKAVELMILLGVQRYASDIHVTSHQHVAGQTRVVLRYRLDGVLHEMCEINPQLLPAIVAEWKRMVACNVHEHHLPQDGRLQMDLQGRPVDLRCSFLPHALGESVTARILDRGAVLLSLDKLPYSDHDQQRIRRALQAAWGVILCTGPTGSGKTTTLYACVSELAGPEKNVLSVEDPVEYLLPWVTQVAVRPDVGLTFDRVLRSMLRSDPDAIMIGEIRDQKTLEIGIQVALTGHLVLSSLHTKDAVGALRRMVEIGADPFMVGDATRLVIAQRLIRRLCRECSVEVSLTPDQHQEASELMRQGGTTLDAVEQKFRKAVGCAKCAQTGFRGRVVIAETLEVTPEISKALRADASVDQLQAIAVRGGMQPMAVDGVRRAAAGETTLDEVRRVLA